MKFSGKDILKWSLFFLLIFNSSVSCKKIDTTSPEAIEMNSDVAARFFNTSKTSDIEVKRLVNDIKKKDSIFKFLPDFVKKNGMPQWDKVFYKVKKRYNGSKGFQSNNNLDGSGTQGLFIIPFQSQNSPRIQSYITAYKHNDSLYTYRLYNKDTLNSLHPTTDSTKKDLLNSQAILGYFEKTVNNTDSIIIPRTANSNLVLKNVNLGFTETNNNNNASFSNNNPSSAWVCVYTTTIYLSYTVIIYIGNGVFSGYYSGTIYMTTDVDCYDDGEPGSGNGWNPGDPNNGSNGNGNGGAWPTGMYQIGGGPFYPWWSNDDPNGGGSGGGFSPAVIEVTSLLGLSNEQSVWLDQNPGNAERLLNYLQTSSSPEKTSNSLAHLRLLMNPNLYDMTYSGFLFLHQYNQDPNSQLMWWEDPVFLIPYGGIDFGEWAINYLAQHPDVSFATFQTQFMSIPEGQDASYDANYWDDPSLTFPPQSLPTLSSFNSHYLKHKDPLYDQPIELYTAIGGQVLTTYNSNPPLYHNTCALRVSRALNYSGVTIPAGPNRYLGADGKYYFLSASALRKWMILTFGMPTGTNKITGAQGGIKGVNFPTLLEGKTGIYLMTPNYPGGCPTPSNPVGTGFCATGHADMILNGVCDGGNYFGARGGVNEILVWELQ